MATNVPRVVTISNEDEAFAYFESALNGDLADERITLRFENWPVVSLSFEGKGYDSTITPSIAEALVEFQHALNRAYARVIHHSTNARTLTAEERRQLQFRAKVEKGSSLINVDLGDYLQSFSTAVVNKMEPVHIVATLIGTALIAGGVISWRSYLKHRSDDIKVDNETKLKIALSQEETRRAEILATAMSTRPQLGFAGEDFADVRREFLRSGSDAESMSMQGVKLSGSEARVMSLTPRSLSEAVQLNGHYTIQKIDWTQPEEVRLSLASTDSPVQFVATLKGDALTGENTERLKEAEWSRRRLYMSINGTRLRGEITTAVIVNVDWPKEDAVANK